MVGAKHGSPRFSQFYYLFFCLSLCKVRENMPPFAGNADDAHRSSHGVRTCATSTTLFARWRHIPQMLKSPNFEMNDSYTGFGSVTNTE